MTVCYRGWQGWHASLGADGLQRAATMLGATAFTWVGARTGRTTVIRHDIVSKASVIRGALKLIANQQSSD